MVVSKSEIDKLNKTIEFMGLLSKTGFSQIEAIAKLAFSHLESPEGYNQLEDICKALEIIQEKAFDIQNCINSKAENVRCNYKDEKKYCRWNAQSIYRGKA